LFGAEVDSEIERGRELQAGIPAEEELQLPARDTKASDKRERKFAEDVARARALRETAGRSQEPTATQGDADAVGSSPRSDDEPTTGGARRARDQPRD
jgi:membrane protein